jgi:hypothetical protein
MSNADCAQGEVCSLEGFCAPVVANCPLTDECLADPEAFVHAWQGIDPIYAGEIDFGTQRGLLWVDIEFYPTHLYGEGQIVFGERAFQVVLTGVRNGNYTFGQVLDAFGGRSFDWTYEAELNSASEWSGSMHFADSTVTLDGVFTGLRISPCGCELEVNCADDAECGSQERCLGGLCQPVIAQVDDLVCRRNSDCGQGAVCVNARCSEFCTQHAECPVNSSCLLGFCVPDCESELDCARGERCDAGTCVPAAPQCVDALDCSVAQRCIDGRCEALQACTMDEECGATEACIEGLCRGRDIGYAASLDG